MTDWSSVRGVLVDVDGVLHIDGAPIPGAVDAMRTLQQSSVSVRLLTNGTMRTRADLSSYLHEMGFDIPADEILTAVTATVDYLHQNHADDPCYLVVSGDISAEFDGLRLTSDERDARVVVFGGASDRFSFAVLNRAYRCLRNGANLVAMHKSVHWLTSDGITLDSGPFIHGLEWAAGTKAVIVGKPSSHFFRAGFDALGLAPEQVAMIGDDPVQDVQAAIELGAIGVLVQTGMGALEPPATVTPNAVIESFAELPGLLNL